MLAAMGPDTPAVKMRCEKSCSVFHFDNLEMVKDTLMSLEAEKMEKESTSFRSLSVRQR